MKVLRPHELPAFLTRVSVIVRREVEAALKALMEEVYTKTVANTRFSFQRWELDEIRTASEVAFILRLPFHTHGSGVPYTSNLWNNPYFADRLGHHASKIHQPLQEALVEVGFRPSPDLKEPISPVPWPNPPNTAVFLRQSDLLNIVSEAMKRVLTKV